MFILTVLVSFRSRTVSFPGPDLKLRAFYTPFSTLNVQPIEHTVIMKVNWHKKLPQKNGQKHVFFPMPLFFKLLFKTENTSIRTFIALGQTNFRAFFYIRANVHLGNGYRGNRIRASVFKAYVVDPYTTRTVSVNKNERTQLKLAT